MMERPKPRAAAPAAVRAPARAAPPVECDAQPLLAAEQEQPDEGEYLERELGGLRLGGSASTAVTDSSAARSAPVGFGELQSTFVGAAGGAAAGTSLASASAPSAPLAPAQLHDHSILRMPESRAPVGIGQGLAPYPQPIAIATPLTPQQEALAHAAMAQQMAQQQQQQQQFLPPQAALVGAVPSAPPTMHHVVQGVAMPVATALPAGGVVFEGGVPVKGGGTIATDAGGAEAKPRRPASPGPAALAAMEPEAPLYSRTESGDYKSAYDEEGGYKSVYETGGAGASTDSGSGQAEYKGPSYGSSADGEYKSAYDEGYGGAEYKPAEYKSVYDQ